MTEPVERSTKPGGTVPAEVKILEDGFAASLSVFESADEFPSIKQIYLIIDNAKVAYGIDDLKVEHLIANQVRGEEVIFARGKLPVGHETAKLIWNVGTDGSDVQRDITSIIEIGRTDIRLYGRVEKDQRIVTKLPAEDGEPGINVFGKPQGGNAADIEIPTGEGIYPSQDGLTLFAADSGIASFNGSEITVMPARYIDGNVNAQTGNIKEDGAVYIAKDVQSGFRVEAVGNIFVGGNVEGADVYSRNGSVFIHNGIIGQTRARILAGENIVAGFIQDATIGAKNDVKAVRYIINSAVTAGNHIIVVSKEGIVRGGTLYAEKKIEIRIGGSDGRIPTELKVGFAPPELNLKEHRDVVDNQRKNRMELAYVQKRLTFLKLLKDHKGELTEEKEAQLKELAERSAGLLKIHMESSEREAELDETKPTDDQEIHEVESIRVHEKIFPEVTLAIGDANLLIDKERTNLMFFRSGTDLKFGPLNQVVRMK